MSQYPVGVFCDFDGTISERDIIVSMGRAFGGPTAAAVIDSVQRREMSVRAGVEAMFCNIPSNRFAEVVSYARARTVIREGFYEFVEASLQRGWMFAVVSGGFDFFVDPVVAQYGSELQVFCNHIDTSGPTLRVEWSVACDDTCDGGCGLCKPTVLRRFRADMAAQVVIGDGVTDFKAARLADYVFARDGLQRACDEAGIAYTAFETFSGIAEKIAATCA